MCMHYIKHFINFLYHGKLIFYFISDCCCDSTSSCGLSTPLWLRRPFPCYVHYFQLYLLLLWHVVGSAVFCACYFLCHQCEYLIFILLNSLIINMHMLYTEVLLILLNQKPRGRGLISQ